MGPLSNLMGIAIAETISVRVVEIAKEHNIILPVLRSSNLDGADERNNELFKKYLS